MISQVTPDAFPFPETAIVNVVGARVGLGPKAFSAAGVVLPANQKAAHIVVAMASDAATRKIKMQVHPVLVAWRIGVETGPGAGWKLGIAHGGLASPGFSRAGEQRMRHWPRSLASFTDDLFALLRFQSLQFLFPLQVTDTRRYPGTHWCTAAN